MYLSIPFCVAEIYHFFKLVRWSDECKVDKFGLNNGRMIEESTISVGFCLRNKVPFAL